MKHAHPTARKPEHKPQPSATRRQLGRSRSYTHADLPPRLRHWHAPRANRWEHIRVDRGPMLIEWMAIDTPASETLAAGARRWVAPGMRWRVVQMDPQARFALDIFADETSAASAPQAVRAALLDEAIPATLHTGDELASLLAVLDPDERVLARGRIDIDTASDIVVARAAEGLCWHPLDGGPDGFTALLTRAPQPLGLADYLGRDHAVIEAALAGALAGDAEHDRWLRKALARHLYIEEQLLFPAWLEAGGNAGWVRGLCNEHKHLRHHLQHLSEPVSQRRFLLLLDGHDEKEEQTVYPDIMTRLGDAAATLGHQAMALGILAGEVGPAHDREPDSLSTQHTGEST